MNRAQRRAAGQRRRHEPGVDVDELAELMNESGAKAVGHAWVLMMAAEQNGEPGIAPDNVRAVPVLDVLREAGEL